MLEDPTKVTQVATISACRAFEVERILFQLGGCICESIETRCSQYLLESKELTKARLNSSALYHVTGMLSPKSRIHALQRPNVRYNSLLV